MAGDDFEVEHDMGDPALFADHEVAADVELLAHPGVSDELLAFYPAGCACWTCDKATFEEPWKKWGIPMRMNLCMQCGDKRCPGASDHRNDCPKKLPS